MTGRTKTIAVIAITLLAAAGSADAQLTTADRRCRAVISTSAEVLATTAMKSFDRCVGRDQLKRSPATDCNTVSAADATGKITKASDVATADILEDCADVPASYPNCPSPAHGADAGGATSGVDDVAELAACEVVINTEGLVPLRNYILRPNGPAIVAHERAGKLRSCAKAIAKGATKLWAEASDALGRCQRNADGPGEPYAYVCSGFTDSDIQEAEAKLVQRVTKKCSILSRDELALLGTCSTEPSLVSACVTDAVKRSAGGATATAFEFAGVCPAQLEILLNAGGASGGRNSATSLDAGWTGLGHDADLFDRFKSTVDLACSSDDCSSCAITAACGDGNCRCQNNPGTECTVPFVAGGVCGVNACIMHVAPPLPLSADATPVCVFGTYDTPLAGVADVGTGAVAASIDEHAKVHLGISLEQPCPVCINDTTFDDGVRDGTCQGGARNGFACDSDARSTAFGETSYDCPPSLVSNITGSGLPITVDLTTGAVSLPFEDSCDAPVASFDCACGSCSLDSTLACSTDADCAGFGTCTNAGGAPRQPNDCDDLVCSADGASAGPDEGVCNAGPVDTFCDQFLEADGDPYVRCGNNADCTGFGAGNCTLSKTRECFLDPIDAEGVAGSEGAEMVAAFCTPTTASASVNFAFGLPGPVRVRTDVELAALCPAPNDDREFELGGSVCN